MRKLREILLRIPVPVKFILMAALPICLYFVPIDKLNGEHTLCLFKNLTGRECWGCGITRAIISAVQFDFAAAFHYNKLVIVVFPLLVYVWAKCLKRLVTG